MDDLNSNTRGVVYSAVFLITAVLAVFGNLVVILTICARKTMRSALNYLIGSIALADIVMAIFVVPVRPVYIMLINWPYGNIGCKLTHMISATTQTVVIITLATISTILFKLVVCPSQKSLTKREGFKISIVIWLVSILIGLPVWIFASVESVVTQDDYCLRDGPIDLQYKNGAALNFTVFTICTTLPAVWLIVAYVIILCKGFRSYSLVDRKPDEIYDHKFNKTMITIMVVISVVHVLCWSILSATLWSSKFFIDLVLFENIVVLVDWMTVMNTVFRPVIYFVMSTKFRSNMLDTILCRGT